MKINGIDLLSFSVEKRSGGECCDFAISLLKEYVEKAYSAPLQEESPYKIIFTEAGQGESVRYAVDNGNLCFYGGNRGIIYSVLEFLEYIGWRFFTPTQETFLGDKGLDLQNGFSYEYTPKYWYRQNIYNCTKVQSWSLRQKVNVEWKKALPSYMGGGITYAGPEPAHTFSLLMPSNLYFEKHPECFALRPDGARSDRQPCLSEGKTFEIMLGTALEWLREKPNADVISLSQNDNWLECHCEKCIQARAEDGSSGALLRFINRMAREIKKEFPLVRIETISYDQTMPAPLQTKPEDNVIIRLCTKGRCHLHNLDDETSAWCKKVYSALQGWSKITKNLQVWEYTASFNYNLIGFPIDERYAHDSKVYATCGVTGILTEGNHLGNSCNFAELASYLHAKISWKPDMGVEEYNEHKTEFIRHYYGNAAPYMEEYLTLLSEYTRDSIIDITPGPFSWIPQKKNGKEWGKEYFEKANAIFEKALSVVEPENYDRVEKEWLQPLYYWSEVCFANDMLNSKSERKRSMALIEKMYELIDKYEIDYVRFGRTGVHVQRKK